MPSEWLPHTFKGCYKFLLHSSLSKARLTGTRSNGKIIDNKILISCHGDPYSKQLYEAKGFVKEVKNHINCVWTGYILQKSLGKLWRSNSKICGTSSFYQHCRKRNRFKHITEEKFPIMPWQPLHNVFGNNSVFVNLKWLFSNLQSNISLIEDSIQMKITISVCYVHRVHMFFKWRNSDFVLVALRNSRKSVILYRSPWTRLRNVSIHPEVLRCDLLGLLCVATLTASTFYGVGMFGSRRLYLQRISENKVSFILPRVYESRYLSINCRCWKV